MSYPYIKCPSCGDTIGPKIDKYLAGLQQISDNPTLSDKEKDEEKVKLLKSLKFRKYCCVPRTMGSRYPTELIK